MTRFRAKVMMVADHLSSADKALVSSVLRRSCSRIRALRNRTEQLSFMHPDGLENICRMKLGPACKDKLFSEVGAVEEQAARLQFH